MHMCHLQCAQPTGGLIRCNAVIYYLPSQKFIKSDVRLVYAFFNDTSNVPRHILYISKNKIQWINRIQSIFLSPHAMEKMCV